MHVSVRVRAHHSGVRVPPDAHCDISGAIDSVSVDTLSGAIASGDALSGPIDSVSCTPLPCLCRPAGQNQWHVSKSILQHTGMLKLYIGCFHLIQV